MALLNGAKDAGEHFLGVRAAVRPIAITDSARSDCWTQSLFGTPIRRVDRRVAQKGEDRGVFDREMRSKALGDAATARLINESIEPVFEMAAGDGDAVGGDSPVLPAVTNLQPPLEDGLHPRGKPVFIMIANQRSTSSQQMREARLMDGVCKTPIRRPAVADQHPVKVRSQHGSRLFEAAPGLDRVDGRVRRGEAPQPLQVRVDFHPVSSGLTTGLPRMVSHNTA